MLQWADENRAILARHVNRNGLAGPAVNPLDWKSHQASKTPSPEGESFLVMMYAAWRDCVRAHICDSYAEIQFSHAE